MTSPPTFKTEDKKPISVKAVKPLSSTTTATAAAAASTSASRAPKKIDMGAAFNYGKSSELGINSPTHRNTHNENLFGEDPVMTKSTGSKGTNDIIEDIFSSATSAPSSDPIDDFDPRAEEAPAVGDFGDFASAFGGSNKAPSPIPTSKVSSAAPVVTEFAADFSSAFSSQPVAVAAAAPPSLDDNFLFNTQSVPTQSSNNSLLGGADLFGNSVITSAFTSPTSGNKDLLSDFGDLSIQGEHVGPFKLLLLVQVFQVHDPEHSF